MTEKLQTVKWAEFKIGDLFNVVGTKSLDSNAVTFIEKGVNFIGRTNEYNGKQGEIPLQKFLPNEPNTITATVIGNYKYVKLQKEPYYCSQNINKLTPKIDKIIVWNDKVAYFFITNIQKFVSLYDYQQGGYKLDDIRQHKISLPITATNDIDFYFMERFIAELEAQRLAELEAYLLATGLKDTTLSPNEERALKEFDTIKWSEFEIGELFERVKTQKLPYKAEELPKAPMGKYVLPCLTSSFMNQGLNYYVPKDGATILKNMISIPSNSDVYRAYFQSGDFTILSDAYAIDWINKERPKSTAYLFTVACINKVTDLPIYSYKNKLGGWNVVKNKKIQLPTKNGQPDYKLMQTLISAIQKLVIKDVVKYADEKIDATKEIINKGVKKW